MQQPWQSLLKLGIVQPMAFPQAYKEKDSLLGSIEHILADDFFGAIEITHITTEELRKEVKNLLTQSYVEVCFFDARAIVKF